MVRVNLALGVLAKACLAMVALFCAQPSQAQRVPVVSGDDVFYMPVDYDRGASCDGRLNFRRNPDFRGGLVARYTFVQKRGASLAQARHDLVDEWVKFSPENIDGRDYIVFTDSNVIQSHDDLVTRYFYMCTYAGPHIHLVRIDYFRATGAEKRRSPRPTMYPEEIVPVDAGVTDYGFLPAPVSDGVIEFPRWPALYSGDDWLKIRPAFGNGLNAVFAFEAAQMFRRMGERPDVEQLMLKGFVVIKADLGGKIVIIVIDPTVITTRQMLEERANIVREFDDRGDGTDMRLQKIVYYPASDRGLDDLRLQPQVLEKFRGQISDIRKYRDEGLREAAERAPTDTEVSEVLAREWSHFSDDPSNSGYDGELTIAGTIFGELHDMKCERKEEIFTCVVGVTYLQGGRPKYTQGEAVFTRDPDAQYRLVRRPPDEIVLIN